MAGLPVVAREVREVRDAALVAEEPVARYIGQSDHMAHETAFPLQVAVRATHFTLRTSGMRFTVYSTGDIRRMQMSQISHDVFEFSI